MNKNWIHFLVKQLLVVASLFSFYFSQPSWVALVDRSSGRQQMSQCRSKTVFFRLENPMKTLSERSIFLHVRHQEQPIGQLLWSKSLFCFCLNNSSEDFDSLSRGSILAVCLKSSSRKWSFIFKKAVTFKGSMREYHRAFPHLSEAISPLPLAPLHLY